MVCDNNYVTGVSDVVRVMNCARHRWCVAGNMNEVYTRHGPSSTGSTFVCLSRFLHVFRPFLSSFTNLLVFTFPTL